MVLVNFYNEYVSDLSKVAIFESKETGDVVTGQQFIEMDDPEENIDLYNLNHLNRDDNFAIQCIGLQWSIFVSDNNKHLIKQIPENL